MAEDQPGFPQETKIHGELALNKGLESGLRSSPPVEVRLQTQDRASRSGEPHQRFGVEQQ